MKYRFEIVYQTCKLKQISDFMACLDVGVLEFCFKDVITFNYTEEEKPISYFKELIDKAMKEFGYVLMNIEGGKIE